MLANQNKRHICHASHVSLRAYTNNIGLEGAFSSTEGALYHHYLPYTYRNNKIDTKNGLNLFFY